MTNKLPENIKNYRRLNNMSQKELADKLNKSPNVISNWERGINSPEIEIVLQLCDIFKCNPNEIFGYEESDELKIVVEIKNLEKQKADINSRLLEYTKILESVKKDK